MRARADARARRRHPRPSCAGGASSSAFALASFLASRNSSSAFSSTGSRPVLLHDSLRPPPALPRRSFAASVLPRRARRLAAARLGGAWACAANGNINSRNVSVIHPPHKRMPNIDSIRGYAKSELRSGPWWRAGGKFRWCAVRLVAARNLAGRATKYRRAIEAAADWCGAGRGGEGLAAYEGAAHHGNGGAPRGFAAVNPGAGAG